MKRTVRGLAGIVVAVATLGGQEPTRLTPGLAGQAVGQVATVCGEVAGFSCGSPPEQTMTIVLRTDVKAPRFDAAVAAADRDLFDPSLEVRYFGQHVCVTGTVTAVPPDHRIWVSRPDQIEVIGTRPVGPTPYADVAYAGCDERVQLPRIVREVKPQYTPRSMRARVQGVVELLAVVDTDGSVRHADVIRSLDPGPDGLDAQAIEAVNQWQFKPGTREDAPVPVVVGIELTFTLGKKE